MILKVPGPFVFTKNLAQPLLENEIFEASYFTEFFHTKNSSEILHKPEKFHYQDMFIFQIIQ